MASLPIPTGAAIGADDISKLSAMRTKLATSLQRLGTALACVEQRYKWPDLVGHVSAISSQMDGLLKDVDSEELPSLVLFPTRLCAQSSIRTSPARTLLRCRRCWRRRCLAVGCAGRVDRC
jgi:hypothetical protein